MKLKVACKVCGKRAKRLAMGENLCIKHYQDKINNEKKMEDNK